MAKKLVIGFAVLSVLALSGPALAAEPETKSMPRGTLQEYKACLDLQDSLKVRRQALDEHVAENNNAVSLLQIEAQELVEAHKKLVLADEVQVDDFNHMTEEHNKKIVASEEQAERVKGEHEAFSKDTLEYNRKCASLVVDLNVRDAVITQRGAAATKLDTEASSASSASSASAASAAPSAAK